MTFIDGVDLRQKVTPGVRTESATSSLNFPLPPRGSSLSVVHRRNLLFTPPRGPLNRLPAEQTEKNTVEHESLHSNSASRVDKSSVNLVRLSDESASEYLGRYVVDSMDQETS